MNIEQLSRKNGEYVDKKGNILDKRKLKFLGEGHLIELNDFCLREENESYYDLRAANLLSKLKKIDKEYEDADAYIINWRPLINEGSTSCPTHYPINFLKKGGFIQKKIKYSADDSQPKRGPGRPRKQRNEEVVNLGEAETQKHMIQRGRGRKSEYDLENPLEKYHKLSKERDHNLTMSELKKIDKNYAKFLENRKYKHGLDLSIIPQGKRSRVRTKNIEKKEQLQ